MDLKKRERTRGISRRIPPKAIFSKKAQITVFIIIGILILFTFAGVLYFTKNVTKEEFTAAGEPVIQDVPQEFQPIKSYTENCLRQIGERGLLVLGEQGGYIYPEVVGDYSTTDPTDSVGLDLEPLKVPYWHHNANPNDDPEIQMQSLQPKLTAEEDPELSIESQLSRFVEEKLEACLDSYAPFSGQGYLLKYDPAEQKQVLVQVAEQSVNFWLKMSFDAAKGDAEISFTQFYVKVPLRLKEYYELASQMTAVEYNYSFLERQALDLIATYGGVDQDKLPPTEAITFDAVPTTYWNTQVVEKEMKDLLASNVPLLRHLGSNNFYRYEYPLQAAAVLDLNQLYQKNYDNMILPLDPAPGLNINFDYFGWEPYFDVNDKNGVIQPSNYDTGNMLPLVRFASQRYYTVYDLSYPVLVTIEDPEALNGEGYRFVFALESNVRNNEPVRSGYRQPAPIAALQQSMVCDENKRNTELIRTVVLDGATKEPLDAVQIGFSVPEQDNCLIGATDQTGKLESAYPAVYGGVGSYTKDGYLTSYFPIDTYLFKDQPGLIGYAVAGYPEAAVELYPYQEINVTFKKKMLGKCIGDACFGQGLFGGGEAVYSYTPSMLEEKHSWTFNGAVRNLVESETGLVMLTRVSGLQPGVFEEEFATTAQVVGPGTAPLQLVPGVYQLTALATSEEPLRIPKEERCTGGVLEAVACFDLDGCCFTFDEVSLDKRLVGQLTWDDGPSYLTITPDQLYGSNELTLYLLSFNLEDVPQQEHVRVLEDMQLLGQLGNLSKILRSDLEPEFR